MPQTGVQIFKTQATLSTCVCPKNENW